MHHANNAVIMQTEQLGRIEALEEELRSSRAKMAELELKMTEQDRVITQLVGDNLEHLQDNMRLTAHINSSQERMTQLEHQLGQVGSVLMGMIEESPPRYSRDLLLDHTSRPGGILLQVGPSLINIDGEYRGGGVVEEVEENEGGGVSIE